MAKFCPECGTAAQGGKFCMECGTRLNEAGTTSSMSAPTPPPMMQSMQTTATNALLTSPAVTQAAAGYAVQTMTAPTAPVPAPANVYERSTSTSPAMAALQAGASRASFTASSRQRMEHLQSRNSFGGSTPSPRSTEGQWTQPAQRQSFPMATAVTSSHKDVFSPTSYDTILPSPVVVPSAAVGTEAQQCYEQCVQTILASKGGNNETGVATFKTNCRLYGLQQMAVATFYASLVQELGADATITFVPTLARLIPDDQHRRELVEYNALQQRTNRAPSLSNPPSPLDASISRPSRSSSVTSNGSGTSRGILSGRYADHPQCDICQTGFDVTKRRHQCRNCGQSICSSCSPLRLLIPPGTQCATAKGYEVSIPQRVCIHCAPQLHPLQEELVAQYAKAHEDNSQYVSKSRIHVPFSNSLFKECQNAADIMGNFFRDDWGAAADRSIPVAFLQKAHGVALLTIVKAGFLITGQIGTGVVVAKLADGSWSAPSAIGVIGLGGGFEIGGEIIEIMIILGSSRAVKVFHKPQVNLGAGLDIAVGPYGRSAMAAASASSSGLNANYSYSLSKGLYAGISLQGTIIASRHDLNRKFYGRDLQPNEILSGHVEAPNAARPLYEAIGYAMQGVEIHKEQIAHRASIMGPCRLCNCPLFVAHTHQIWNKNCKTCKHVH